LRFKATLPLKKTFLRQKLPYSVAKTLRSKRYKLENSLEYTPCYCCTERYRTSERERK